MLPRPAREGGRNVMQAHIPLPAFRTSPSGTEVGVFDPPISERATSESTVASVRIPVDGTIELHLHDEREMWFVTQKHGLQNTGDSPLRLIAVWWTKAR
jgi:hypothetical protein